MSIPIWTHCNPNCNEILNDTFFLLVHIRKTPQRTLANLPVNIIYFLIRTHGKEKFLG